MKKMIFIGLILSVIISAGCGKSAKDKLLGTWKLNKVEGETLTQEELNATMTFTTDGKFAATARDEKMDGTWELAEDGKTLTLTFKENDKEVWNITEITDAKLVYKQGNEKESIELVK